MTQRRIRRRRDFPGRLELPGDAAESALGRLRRVVSPEGGSALDVIDAERRAALARAPGHVRLGLRLSFLAVVALGLLAVLLVRLWSIQVIHTNSAQQSAIATTTRVVDTPAPRGTIRARGGQELAGDVSELVVTLKTTLDASTSPATRVASPRTEADLAALIPGLTVAAIKKQLNNEQYGPYQPVPVAEGISASAATKIEENPGEFPGATVTQQYVRDYPQNDLAAQMVGYLASNLSGASGLESSYNTVLSGKAGKQVIEVDPQGNPVKTMSTTAPTPGDTVVLNMDLGLERKLATALSDQIHALRAGTGAGATGSVPADWGAAVVLGPKGQVLAIASDPSYNNNEWVGGISDAAYAALQKEVGYPLNDYALTGDQPPGSTFKLATATAALDDGIVNPGTIIYDPGYFNLPGGQTLHDSSGEHPGPIDISTAITISSDVFFYNLGADFWYQRARLGQTPIQDMAAKYGYGQLTGIDLPGESHGWVDSPQIRKALHAQYPQLYTAAQEQWYLGDNVEMAFGQGETVVTPLEQADAFATFADGGTRYAPEMAAAIVSPDGKVVRRIQPKVEAHVPLPASTYNAMLAGFDGAVQNPSGTAYADFVGFNFNKWDLAGKTGTADVAPGSAKQPTAWFVAFGGPKGSSTRYTVAVEIDQAGYGADAAAPVARQVVDYLYAHGVPKLDLGTGG